MGYEAEIVFLEHKRDGLKKKLVQYRSLLSPIHRLPPEVLRHIFTMFEVDYCSLQPPIPAPAMAVAATCGRWRDIAISAPSLWSRIAVEFIEWKKSYHALVPLTQLFMDRSRESPLELIFNFEGLDVLPAELVPSLENLVQHSNRWRNLKLWCIPKQILVHEVFKSIAGHLPLLANLLIFGPYGERSSTNFHCDLFGDCPNLSSITFEAFNPLRPEIPLPTGQIKSCVVLNSSSHDAFMSISSFPSVERIGIQWCGKHAYGGEHVMNPSVKHLSITAAQPDEAYCAFKYSTLPQLTSLEMSCTTGASDADIAWKDWDEVHVADFFVRSACALISLSPQYVPTSDDQLLHFLRLMPSLESLQLEESTNSQSNRTITGRFLNRLAIDYQDMSPPFLPRLRRIKFIMHEDGLVEAVLPKTLASRWIPDDQYASEVGIDCIKSIDIVFIAEDERPVDALLLKLQWMSTVGVWVTVATCMSVKTDDMDEELEREGNHNTT
uniref:F-box domain-containing protein n=1 Tax=Moniliophthora roreri TaxID=221103 RepID=A0A0W0F748_MONRR